jgi:acetyltransferase-like isoleucine patch superfamily enzyme
MAYLTYPQLRNMGFKSLGENVKISDKASIYDAEKISLGDNSRIDDYCILSGVLSIGKFVHITPMCLIAGGVPGIYLDDYSTIAYGVKIFSQSDDYSGMSMTNSLIPKKYKNEIFKSVSIGKFSIIGAGSIILPGADIGEGVAIGAMSLVLKPVEEWMIYAGIPARKIKRRSRNIEMLATNFEKESNDSI